MAKKSFPFNFCATNFPTSVKCARLHLKRKGRCLFFTITDMDHMVVAVLTLGQVALSTNRRVKCSLVTIDRLIFKMRRLLKNLSITKVFLLFRSSFQWQLRNLERFFRAYGISVFALENRQRTPHGFMRLPKKPRK